MIYVLKLLRKIFRLDEETEELHHERVSLSLGKTIQQARQAKEWGQKDLATVLIIFLITLSKLPLKTLKFGNFFY